LNTVFIINGPLSAIIAISLYKILANEIGNNVYFLIERVESVISVERQTKTTNAYGDIASALIKANIEGSRIEIVEIKRYFVNPIKSPIGSLKEHRQILRIYNKLDDEIKNTPTKIIFSGNSILQNYIAKKGMELIKYEHGIGDYIDAKKMNLVQKLKAAMRKRAQIFLGIPWERIPDKRYLMDKNQSETLRKYGVNSIISCDAPRITESVQNFLKKNKTFGKSLIEICEKINGLSEIYKVILYLPSESIPFDSYCNFLSSQIENIDIKKTFFYIKCHPIDSGKYGQLFKDRKLMYYEIEDSDIKNVPAEIIISMCPQIEIMGRGSSVLFYSKWWFNRKVHTTNDKTNSKIINNIEKNMKLDLNKLC